MKTFLITTIAFLALTITCKAQWTTSGNSIVPASGNLGYNVGVGTATPNANLETQATTEQLRVSYDATHFASFTTSAAGSLAIKPTGSITLNPSQYVYISSNINTGLVMDAPTGLVSFARIRTGTTGSISDFSIYGGVGSTNNLRFVDNKTSTNVMTLASNDFVGIGTINPDQKLTVQGTIHSTSVLVDTNVPTPDYVFKSDYHLPTLAEVKAYTDKNHHLPEVPAAAEFEKNGINLGQMNMTLLKKVEELTLYLIEQNKEIKETNGLAKKVQDETKLEKEENKVLYDQVKKLEQRLMLLEQKKNEFSKHIKK